MLRTVILFLFYLGVINIAAGNCAFGLDCCYDGFLFIIEYPQMELSDSLLFWISSHSNFRTKVKSGGTNIIK